MCSRCMPRVHTAEVRVAMSRCHGSPAHRRGVRLRAFSVIKHAMNAARRPWLPFALHALGAALPGLRASLLLGLAGLGAGLAFSATWPAGAAERPDLRRVETLIVDGTNAFRRTADLPPVTSNAALKSAATSFAAYMARTDHYGHEADGRSPAQRATEHGYDYCIVLENIAYEQSSVGFDTSELAGGLVDGWRRSPPHRRNMLDPAVTDIGVGLAHSPRTGRYYAVQLFGLPHSARISFTVANRTNSAVHYSLGRKSYRLEPGVTNTHEQCTAPTFTLKRPGGAPESTAEPKNGERFAVEPDGAGGVRLERH